MIFDLRSKLGVTINGLTIQKNPVVRRVIHFCTVLRGDIRVQLIKVF